jgi:hypothetical protein
MNRHTFTVPVAVRMQNKWALKETQAGSFIILKPELKFGDFRIRFEAELQETLKYLGARCIELVRFVLSRSAHGFNEKLTQFL